MFPGARPFHTRVLRDLKQLLPGLTISPEAQEVLDEQDAASTYMQDCSLDGFEPVFKNYQHQNEALSSLIWNPRYGLFLGRGLGKTKIIIDLLSYLRTKNPNARALILALRVNVYTWVDEFAKFTNGSLVCLPLKSTGSVSSVHKNTMDQAKKDLEERVAKEIQRKYGTLGPNATEGMKRARELAFDKAFKRAKKNLPTAAGLSRQDRFKKQLEEINPAAVVVTYETASVSLDALLEYDYDIIIADESHKLRGHNSKITKTAIALADRAERRVLVTGTANLGDPLHLWGQLRFLGKFVVPDFWSFKKRHVVTSPWNSHIITGYQNIDKLNKLVSNLSIQREAEECLDLPDRVFQRINVDPNPELKEVYNNLVKDKELAYKDVSVNIQDRIVELGKLAQLSTGFFYLSRKNPNVCDNCSLLTFCTQNEVQPYTKDCKVVSKDPGNDVYWIGDSSPVIDAVKELVQDHLSEGKKVIVWAKHVEVLDRLYRELSSLCDPDDFVVRYDSTTENPSEAERQFNENEKARIILAQISMGIGVTFKAPVMVYAEVDWRLDSWLQSLDRNFGIRAKGFTKLLVQTVAIKNSLADFTMKLLEAKYNVADLFQRRPDCGGCDMSFNCFGSGIAPFTPGCKYTSTAAKTTIRSSSI
jgi:SNF2 family DNA or RNA helicase